MKSITVQELHSLQLKLPELAVIDVRTPVEFAQVHIAGTRSVPIDELDPGALVRGGHLRADAPVYVLCLTEVRARNALAQFTRHGQPEPVLVQGGIQAWIDAGLPVVRGSARGISLERQVRIAAGSLVLVGALLGWRLHPAFFGLSAFVGGGLVFAGITDFCGMGLLLARAPWNKRVAH